MANWTIPQRKLTRAERAAEAGRIARENAQEAMLSPAFDPEPQTEFERALSQAITAGADNLRSTLAKTAAPHAQGVAARALYAADANALYTALHAEAAASQRDLSAFETQCSLSFVRRELDASVTRALTTIDTIRQDARQHLPARLHNFLKAERAKRDRQTRTITISAAQRAEELGLPLPTPKAHIIPPAGHPDHDRLLAEAMAALAAETADS
jgi:hypothetical protein